MAPKLINLEKELRPQITQVNANGSVALAGSADHPKGEPDIDTKHLIICVYLRLNRSS
jgi:hypothetical protein